MLDLLLQYSTPYKKELRHAMTLGSAHAILAMIDTFEGQPELPPGRCCCFLVAAAGGQCIWIAEAAEWQGTQAVLPSKHSGTHCCTCWWAPRCSCNFGSTRSGKSLQSLQSLMRTEGSNWFVRY